MKEQIEQQGFAIVPGVLSDCEQHTLLAALEPALALAPTAGIRNLARKIPDIDELAHSANIAARVEPILGPGARLVRSILFNKSPEANWHVAWHQDLTVAVRERSDAAGYDNWTIKEGVLHVQPPLTVLENMLTVRLHLDATDADNGALWVAPGSHRLGRIATDQINASVDRLSARLCAVPAGGALLMRPLLLHASFKACTSRPRRVIHLEFAAAPLAEGLAWAEQ